MIKQQFVAKEGGTQCEKENNWICNIYDVCSVYGMWSENGKSRE